MRGSGDEQGRVSLSMRDPLPSSCEFAAGTRAIASVAKQSAGHQRSELGIAGKELASIDVRQPPSPWLWWPAASGSRRPRKIGNDSHEKR